MKFKKNWKRFWTLDRHCAEGFTLVELIVVIAILAILGGVAVPAYSGYVEKANKAADQTLVSEVVNALILQHYTTPDFEGVAAVALTDNGAFAGEGDTFADTAMTAVFGDSWDTQGNLALSYGGWNGAANAQKVLNYFGSVSSDNPLYGIYNGTDIPSFAADVDDLFVLVKDTAMSVAGKNGSGAELIQGASNLTVNNKQNVDSSKFAEYWAGNTWNSNFLMGDSTYDASVSELDNGDLLNSAVANAAVIKARNTSVATYLRNQGYSEDVYNLFANYTYGSNSIVPKDVTIEFFGENDADTNPEFGAALEKVMTETEAANIQNDLMTYFGVSIDDSGNPVKTLEGSQAYTDGLAYFAMMDTINQVKDENPASDETYWDEMAGAVSLYGSIAQGEASLEQLNNAYGNLPVSGNSIVITAMISNGTIVFDVNPHSASVGDQ